MTKWIGVFVLALMASVQAEERTAVGVTHSGEDRVGTLLVSAVKEELARSARFKFDSGSISTIDFVSMDPDRNAENRTAAAVGLDLYIWCPNHKTPIQRRVNVALYLVGRDRVQTMATEIVSDMATFWDKQQCGGSLNSTQSKDSGPVAKGEN